MNEKMFIDAIDAIVKEKQIEREVIFEAMELALTSAYKKNFNQAQNVRVNIDEATGAIEVFSQQTVVEEVEDTFAEISLDAAEKINKNYSVGDIIETEVTPKDFGRVAAQTAKQVILQKIREAERQVVYDEYVDKEDDIITGIVAREDARNYYIDLGKTHGVLAKTEISSNERIAMNNRIKVYVSKIDKTPKGPVILLSRTHPNLIRRLFELEVPEIYEGVVEVKNIVREAGERSKISVHTDNPDIDPIGACVGQKGARINFIVNELSGEKIDIVKWDKDPKVFITNALSPSSVTEVIVTNEEKTESIVVVPDNQLSLAIGKRGQNARLAARLTGWKVDIKSESDALAAGIEFTRAE